MENVTLTLPQFLRLCGSGFSLGFFMGFLTYVIRVSKSIMQSVFVSGRD